MRFLTHVAILFYVIVITFLSGIAILFSLQLITLQEVTYYLEAVYSDPELRQLVGLVSGVLVLLSFLFAKFISGSRQREKNIAFDNPSGRVSISLNAVEDLIRRIMHKLPEVKEVRPNIIATKRGLEVEVRLNLSSDVNIPEMTSKLQDLVRRRIQDIIGIDENVNIRIHIGKITVDESKQKTKKAPSDSKEELSVPFQGYRH